MVLILLLLKLTKIIINHKKSVLMTLNHNCGYFSGVGGIAGNSRIAETKEYQKT